MLTQGDMPAMVDEILAKAGYVRLSKYGLMLTPQGHIISLQPRLPDEGSSARIVGWLEGCEPNGALQLPDLFVNPPRAAAPAVASPVATPRPSAPPPPPAAKAKATRPPLPGVAPVQPDDEEAMWAAALARAKVAAEPAAAPIAVPPPVPARPAPKLALVAPSVPPPPAAPAADDLDSGGDEDDGDEWEWQLALARARAAAEEAEAAKAVAPPPPPRLAPVAAKPAPAPAPVAVIPPKEPAPVTRAPARVTRSPEPAPIAASSAPPRERPSMQPRPMRASNTTGWKPPVPPTRGGSNQHVNDQTSPKPKLPLVAEPTGTETRRIARGTESPPAVVATKKESSPRLTLVSTEPRPLPPPAMDDDTHVDLNIVKKKSASKNDEPSGPTPLPRLSARR